MSRNENELSKAQKSRAYRDFRFYRRRLSCHLAVLREVIIDTTKNSRLASEDQFGLPSDLFMICDYVERFIALSNARMERGNEQEKATVAEISFLLGGILGLVPSTAREIEVAGRAVTRDRSEEGTRRAAGWTAKMQQAAEKTRDFVETTLRNPTDQTRPLQPGATWAAMRVVVGDDIDDKTARKYWQFCINNPRSRTVGG